MATVTIHSLFTAAMALDEESRRSLAEQLWESTQVQDDSVFSETTWQEIERRVSASDAGLAQHIPGEMALAQVRTEFSITS